jgi:DNA-binding NarL/FixJ family response regulator
MTTSTDPRPADVTEPQQVLHLSRAGLSTRRIAELLSLSQSTVTRRLREASQMEVSARWRRRWMAAMFALLTSCAVTVAAALATMVWGG